MSYISYMELSIWHCQIFQTKVFGKDLYPFKCSCNLDFESMEKGGKQFPALRENIAQFVLFMFMSLKNSILERLEVATKSGAQIEFIFEFSLPTCQLIDIGNIENIKEIKRKHEDYNCLNYSIFAIFLYFILLRLFRYGHINKCSIFIGHTIEFSGDKALKLTFYIFLIFSFIDRVQEDRNNVCLINEQRRLT